MGDRIGRKGVLAATVLMMAFGTFLLGVLPALFPTSVRNGVTSIAYNLSVSAFGDTTSLIAAALVQGTGDNLVPAYVLIVAGVVGIVSVYFTLEPAGKALKRSAPAAASEKEAREIASNT